MAEYEIRPSSQEPIVVIPSGMFVEPVHYEVSCLPKDSINRPSFTVDVEMERDGWVVKVNGFRRDIQGKHTEPRSGESTKDWWTRHHFDLPTALALAVKLAPGLTCGGRTVTEALKDYEEESDE